MKQSKHANHTKYSNYVILSEVDKFKAGKFRFKTQAFRSAGKILGLREDQVAAHYYDLIKAGHTSDDFKDYTEQDKNEFYPGSGEPVDQRPRVNNRSKSPEGYEKSYQDADNFEDLKKKHEKSEKIILTKNEDNSESVHLLNIKQAVKSLTKDTPPAFRKQLIQDLLNGL